MGMLLWLALVLVGAGLLGGCGAADAGAGDGAVTVMDALGRTVSFEKLPQRIVIAGRATLMVADSVYLFPKAGERLVAVTSGNQSPGRFLSLVDPAFTEKTTLAPDAGPEQIAPLQPDVVILRSMMAETLGAALDELEIPVVYVDLETPEQFLRDVATLGQILGDEARAEEIQAFYQARLEAVTEAVGDLEAEQRPRVLLVQHSAKGGEVAFNVPPAGWLQTQATELAGGVPVWAEAAPAGGWTVVNFEQIAAWDPDQIYVVSYSGDPAAVVAGLRADPQWQVLRAGLAGEIYGYAGDLYSWDQPDPRWVLGLTWLAGKMHPARFADVDMRQAAATFFEEMYGMEAEAVEAQILTRLQGDIE
jgi:iron complex transport system substrate-binding protein